MSPIYVLASLAGEALRYSEWGASSGAEIPPRTASYLAVAAAIEAPLSLRGGRGKHRGSFGEAAPRTDIGTVQFEILIRPAISAESDLLGASIP